MLFWAVTDKAAHGIRHLQHAKIWGIVPKAYMHIVCYLKLVEKASSNEAVWTFCRKLGHTGPMAWQGMFLANPAMGQEFYHVAM